MSMMSMRRRKGMEVGSGGVGRILGGVFAAVWLGAAGTASALPLLSEVYYDAVGSDDGELFVEIAGRPGTSLEGWVVEGVNGANGAAGPTIVLSGAIGETGLFVVADQRSDGTTSILGADWWLVNVQAHYSIGDPELVEGGQILAVRIGDGSTGPIDGDVNGDGKVDGSDLGLVLAGWGSADPSLDLNGDGQVDGADLGIVLANWTG